MEQRKNQSAALEPPDWREVGLEFEITNIEEARQILDTESLTQFDLAAIVRPEDWQKLRRPSLPTDRALTGQAIDWLLALPANLRPEHLTLEFPRVVNLLAQVWHEPEPCQAALDSLLCPGDRKKRAGFPSAVLAELVALRDWTQLF